jgi:hypothetical protein
MLFGVSCTPFWADALPGAPEKSRTAIKPNKKRAAKLLVAVPVHFRREHAIDIGISK